MENIYSKPTMAELRQRHGFKHSKSLGQNFLADGDIIDHIITGSGIGPDDLVIEIGPGMGVLTREAAEVARRVVAIEIDRDLLPILAETLADYDNVEIVHADIMKVDLAAIVAEHASASGSVRIIGNLPYYITTPIIMKLLEDRVPAASITIMMQKEVADRIKAAPGTRDSGALTAAVHYYSTVEHIADAPRSAFVPQPKVDSTVIRLDLRDEPPVELADERIFFEVIKNGYGQRRKTLLNSLTGIRGLPKDTVGEVLDACGIDRKRRAETLTLEEFARIANDIARRL
jgi:16S rRNA (adenine1518-N6/adenine1519-N6)-dimethyltransferase